MKKLNLLFIGILSMSFLNAQNITDALRYSQSEIQGTARYRALSGAFGALGGDMSAVSANPASSAVFTQSHASFTGSFDKTKNNSRYFNGMGNSSESNFDISQGGASFVFTTNSNSPWKKFSLGVAYDRINNFNDNWGFTNGINTNDDGNFSNSISSYFFDYSNGLRLDQISAIGNETDSQAYSEIGNRYGYGNQQGFLGFTGFILEPGDLSDDANTNYTLNLENGNFNHDYTYASTGYNGKIAFNFATQYGDNLSLGLNLNSHFINYDKSTLLFERNSNGGNNPSVTNVNFIEFENNLSTTGSGFSFQLGGILKITEGFRAGITYDSSTWYTIKEETSQYLGTNGSEGSVSIDPQITNSYPEYKLQTPSKITGSLAYVFGTHGLLSFDYSHKDYSKSTFKPTSDPDFQNTNTAIKERLQAASTYRLGGEFIVKQFSFRGGYRFEDSPYKDGVTVGDLNGYSAGFGYNFGNIKLDATFDQSNRSFETALYSVGLTDAASVDRKNSNITVSLSFNI